MDEAPDPGRADRGAAGALPPDLRFLRRLVTLLTAVMIAGLVAVIWLLVIRLPAALPREADLPVLPEAIAVPEGARVLAFTRGPGWYAVVTETEIRIHDAASGALRQAVRLEN